MPNLLEEAIARQKRLAEKTYKPGGVMAPTIFGQEYWWYGGFTKEGRQYIEGVFGTKAEAESAAAMDPDLDVYETFTLPTRDRTRARGLVKAKGIMEGIAGQHYGSDTMLKRVRWGPKARAKARGNNV